MNLIAGKKYFYRKKGTNVKTDERTADEFGSN